jgi:pilus assembly protein CpaB
MAISAPARPTSSQSRPAARKPLFLIGIAMSVVAFLLVIILGSVVAGRATVSTAQVSVVVAAQDIHHRTVVGAADLTAVTLPVNAVPPEALFQRSLAIGKIAQVDVLKGQPITSNLVAAEGAGEPSLLPIPAGWVAATIPASEQQAVAGYVSPGDVIDLAATVGENVLNPAAANPRQLTRTVFPGLRVLRVGAAGSSGKSGQQQGIATSLTVLVTQCDAPYMDWLINNSTVRYTLRSSADYGKAPTAADPSCPAGSPTVRVGPAEVDKKFGLTKG